MQRISTPARRAFFTASLAAAIGGCVGESAPSGAAGLTSKQTNRPPTNELALTLTAEETARAEVVSLGVPFGVGVVQDPARVTVLDDGGHEVPASTRSLATWPEDGSQRSVLVAFRATMRAGETRRYWIRYGQEHTAFKEPLAPNPDGPIVASLDPAWYASSRALGREVPASGDAAFARWEAKVEDSLSSMSPPWESYGLSCDSTSMARTYYDSPHTLYQRYTRRGTVEAYRRARAEARWYRAHELTYFEEGKVAVHTCVPTWDPSVPLDWDKNRWLPIRRLTGQGMLDDYLLTGDPEAAGATRAIGEAFRQDLTALTTIPPITVKATERNLGFTMLALASYYALDHTEPLRAALAQLVDLTAAWQAEGTSGAFEHDINYADITECARGPKGGSPFMTAILVEGLMNTWDLLHPSAIPDIIIKAARWLRDDAITSDGRAFRYLWGCEDNAYDDSSTADLNLLIVHVFGAAYLHSGDARWLDFGDKMAAYGVEKAWLGNPKHWSQATQSFITYLGYRSDGPSPAPQDTGVVPGVAAVWAIHDGEKIDRDDLDNPYKASNEAWDGQRVRLFGARNEVLAFQLVVESDSAGVAGLEVSLPALEQRGGTASIRYTPPGANPTDYVGRPIQVFVEHYLHVTEATRAPWVFDPVSPAAPRDPTGWKPVQLVPENAKPRTGGLPIDVAPRRNQAIWIEIYTARDLPRGTYDGTIQVRAGGEQRLIPLELELFDFTLPDESSMRAMLYFDPSQVELYQGHALEDRYHRFAHRHRVELVRAYDPVAIEASLDRYDGSAFTPPRGYEGPGEGKGAHILPATFYGPGDKFDDRASAWKEADAWMSFLSAKVPGALTFLYTADEPQPSEYERISRIASNVKSNPGPGRELPIFVTSAWTPALDGLVDIWCANAAQVDVARAAEERARGRRYWYYNGHRPSTGTIIIDAPATDARANMWAAFKHDLPVYFHWHSDHWQHNPQKVGDRNQNVWANPVTFDNRGQPNKPVVDQGFINGDGVLMYPGEEVLHPEEDRGVAGPISTVQLANLRRGLQDHQYLTLARALGREAQVERALAAVVPAVFSEAGERVGFAEHGDAYERARHALAQAIVGSK